MAEPCNKELKPANALYRMVQNFPKCAAIVAIRLMITYRLNFEAGVIL
jgi:hypothetical protein